jgi:hypothetical protein
MASAHHHHLEMFVKGLHVRWFRAHNERGYCFFDCNNVLCFEGLAVLKERPCDPPVPTV